MDMQLSIQYHRLNTSKNKQYKQEVILTEQKPTLDKELQTLGSNIEQIIQNMLSNDTTKNIYRDLSGSFQEIGKQVQSVQDNPSLRDLTSKGQQVINTVQENDVVQGFQAALAAGISQLNQQLTSFIHTIPTKNTNQKPQKIKIED
jgi:C-terminal processing protease CtpA/Prc